MRPPRRSGLCLLVAAIVSCSRASPRGAAAGAGTSADVEAVSFLGEKLYAPVLPPERRRTIRPEDVVQRE